MIRLSILYFILSILSGIGVDSVRAQITSDTLSLTMDTLRVEAVRSNISSVNAPLSLSIKTRTLREQSADASSSLASITRSLPGIWVNNRNNDALGERITIRGIGWRAAFGVRGIQVVLDGIPLTVADGQSITNIIDPTFIQRVELIRGPAASYWGNSSGGVLYISTKPDYDQPYGFYFRTYDGSYQNRKSEFKFKQSSGHHKINGYTSYNYNNGYRNYSSSKKLRSGVQGSYQFNDGSHLEYLGALLWMPEAEHPSGLTAAQLSDNRRQANQSYINADAGKQVTQSQLGLSYHKNTPAGFLTVSSHGIYRDLTNPLPFGIITVNRWAGGARGSLEKDIAKFTFKAGAEIKYQHDNREEFENNAGIRGATTVNQLEKVSNQALFFSLNYQVKKINFSGSLRYDRITFLTDSVKNPQRKKRAFNSLNPSLGVSYRMKKSTLYANLSTSFEAPTTTELVNRPDGGNGFNPNLKPEKTAGFEVGSRGLLFDNFLSYDISLYQLWIQDLLFPYQLRNNGPTYYRNQGKTRHKGIEIASTLHLTKNLSFHTAYSLTDAQFIKAETLDSLSLKGKAVPGVAKHRVSADVKWSPSPFWIQLSGQYVNSYPVNNLNTASNDQYFLADAKLSYQKKFTQSGMTLTPFINIHNILNRKYNGSVVVNASGGRYYEPAPGRTWQAGISVGF